jgi:DNA-binding GntR family transcriptional regulator
MSGDPSGRPRVQGVPHGRPSRAVRRPYEVVMSPASREPVAAAVVVAEEEFGPGRVYEQLRDDIARGRLPAGSRLKTAELARRYGTSTNPVREALQQLRGEGFVVISHNRGARVRDVDEDFVRNVSEITAMIEPYMTRWFVGQATAADVAAMKAIQAEIEKSGFDDTERYSVLDGRFHRIIYDRHYNRHAFEIWWRHREILRIISRPYPFSLARRHAVVVEHRELIAAIEAQDADQAAAVIERHVRGSGRHVIERLRAERAIEASRIG